MSHLRASFFVVLFGSSVFAQTQPVDPQRTFLNSNCAACHSDRAKFGGLSLQSADPLHVATNPDLWEKVVRRVSTGSMPPSGARRPDKTAQAAFLRNLENSLDRLAESTPNPGRVGVHRLNRAEYLNSVRDLLGVELDDQDLLPADDSVYGFDNIGDALSVSPMLLERYLAAAHTIVRVAIGDPAAKPASKLYRIPKSAMQEDQVEGLPFGSRGGAAIRHLFPRDGTYEVKLRLRRDYRDYVVGLLEQHQIEIRLDGERLSSFTIGGEHKGKSGPIFSTNELGDAEQELYERTADEPLKIRFEAKSGVHILGVDFVRETGVTEGPLRPRLTPRGIMQYKGGNPSLDSLTVAGPYQAGGLGQPESRKKIFVCQPSAPANEETCAKTILSKLARRAYRRPATPQDLQTLAGLFHAGRKNGGFESGIALAVRRILGPEFLFRIERDPQLGITHPVTDLELASRLSFFLWSSIPDDRLLDLALADRLHSPDVLESEVRRMLADPKSSALSRNFALQWLNVRNLRLAKPDPVEFPNFDEDLRLAFETETKMFVESILRENRSVLELLNANYTFLNERLARHYGIPNVYGSHFRRVDLAGGTRGGLLGQGSILTVTSYANRTAPTIRGKWLLENILGTPPAPPPPDVPALSDSKESKSLNMRQRMEQHASNAVCASCHSRMDPLGFALEAFDGIGAHRPSSARTKIDTAGKLPDGTVFDGPEGLRTVLSSKPEQFLTTFTEKLLTFALGRGLEPYDQPAVRKIVRGTADQYRWSDLILGIVRSTPFRMRRS